MIMIPSSQHAPFRAHLGPASAQQQPVFPIAWHHGHVLESMFTYWQTCRGSFHICGWPQRGLDCWRVHSTCWACTLPHMLVGHAHFLICLNPALRESLHAAQGALYASNASPDSPAMLVYRPFEAWAPNSDWCLPLPEGESPVAVAAARSLLALATSTQTLRLFSPAGVPSQDAERR